MDNEAVRAFNAELTSVYDTRPPLSKKKIQDISKAALKAKTFYKHVVFSVEKFLAKCKIEYKIPCLYVIDSIIRASRHQLKEKDVYAARFLKNFSKTLSDLLLCPVVDQPRVVRTLNLWGANGVFTIEEMLPFKQQCVEMGIEVDVEKVEKAVKGSRADMSIYGGAYIKKEKEHNHRRSSGNKFEAQTPPHPVPSSSASQHPAPVPTPSKTEGPSDEIPQGAISERELLELMRSARADPDGLFSTDIFLLRKAHAVICNTLQERQRADSNNQGNIKNLLSKGFDYSDEEDSGDEGQKPRENQPKVMSHQEVVALADVLIRDANVLNALRTMQQERVASLNQVAAAAQAQQRALASVNMTIPPPGLPAGIAQIAAGKMPAGLQIPGLPPGLPGLPPGINFAQLAGLAGVSAAGGASNPLLNLLASNPMMAQMSNLLGQPPPGLPFSPNRPPPQANLEQMANQQQELLKHLNSLAGNMAVPPPGLGLLGAPPTSQPGLLPPMLNSLPPQLQQQMKVQLHIEDIDMRGEDDDRDPRNRKDRKRSRSRDRTDHKRRRSRSRERKDKDKIDRERRKVGLPPIVEGHTMIASRTLWFGRLPLNCSDTDIKYALAPIGTGRINIIPSRACAYVVVASRKDANEVIKNKDGLTVAKRPVKVNWAMGAGAKSDALKPFWNKDEGVSNIPWANLPSDMEGLCEGAHLDTESLPLDKRTLYTETGSIALSVPPMPEPEMEMASDDEMHSSPVKSSTSTNPVVNQSPMKMTESLPPHIRTGLPPGFPFPVAPAQATGGFPGGLMGNFPQMRLPGQAGPPGQPMFGLPPGMMLPPPGNTGLPHGMGIPPPNISQINLSAPPPNMVPGPAGQMQFGTPNRGGVPPGMPPQQQQQQPSGFNGAPSGGHGNNFRGNAPGGPQRDFNGGDRGGDEGRQQWNDRDRRDDNGGGGRAGGGDDRRQWNKRRDDDRFDRDRDNDRRRGGDDERTDRRKSRWDNNDEDKRDRGRDRGDRRDDRDRRDRDRRRDDRRDERDRSRDREPRDRSRERERSRDRGEERDRRDREDRRSGRGESARHRERSPRHTPPGPESDEIKSETTKDDAKRQTDIPLPVPPPAAVTAVRLPSGSDDAEAMVTSTTDLDAAEQLLALQQRAIEDQKKEELHLQSIENGNHHNGEEEEPATSERPMSIEMNEEE